MTRTLSTCGIKNGTKNSGTSNSIFMMVGCGSSDGFFNSILGIIVSVAFGVALMLFEDGIFNFGTSLSTQSSVLRDSL